MDRRILEYIIKILFKDWKAFEGISGILVSATAFLIPDIKSPDKIEILIIGATVIFFVKVVKQFYKYFMNFYHPIKVVRKVQGDGGYSGIEIIVLHNQENVDIGMLLTLFCNSSGAEQPVCILEVLSCENGKEIIAKQVIPMTDKYSIDKYFEEDSRKKSLYAKTIVNSNIINSFQKIK